MNHIIRIAARVCFCLLTVIGVWNEPLQAQIKNDTIPISVTVVQATKTNGTTVDVTLSNGRHLFVDFYGDNIFRLYQDNDGLPMHDPVASPPARILVDQPRKTISGLAVHNEQNAISIQTPRVIIEIDKSSRAMRITNRKNNRIVIETVAPIEFDKNRVTLRLKERPDEYFYGGGVQNGRFSHRGKAIAIENQNSWTDGGVASPNPFYWSTGGYGLMWYTFKKGKYDFGLKEKNVVSLSHETSYLDVFFMIDEAPAALLNDFYQLTGNPVLLPKFAFYEGHLNAYNRDYWKEDSSGIVFEDGKRYKESQKDNGGIKESLNGEKNNYQFSARAVIDRYAAHDMPLGWILPNDGYGAGYGQTGTLDSNILNLKSFGDYARAHGVQIGLWTQSDLHPKENVSPLLQRDIIKEVGVAGVRVLKTDVAWVGPGYSFGLNGVADVAHIMSEYGNQARPFIISLDGWAGTQRYAGVWSGDQTGGQWEYIRFHIPTYIGSGLSGEPNITSDMDGIFGGKNPKVNARDFEWKAFTPMQLNMDGWGANEKYPHALGEPVTSINRTYLKLKSALLPYTYSVAREAVTGLPLMRALFLDYPNEYTHGTATRYEYLYGPSFLVAPVYKDTRADAEGNDIRDGIYLPEGTWIDYFSGQLYTGNCIVNNFDAPLWKLPLFVKSGAIIPMTHPNNHVSEVNKAYRIYELYPAGKSSFTEYDDDGVTEAYKAGAGVTTFIESSAGQGMATVTVHPAKGDFTGFVKKKATEFRVNVTQKPAGITVKKGNTAIRLKEAKSYESFQKGSDVYFYDAAPDLNRFSTAGSDFAKVKMIKNPQLLVKVAAMDVTLSPLTLVIKGFEFAPANHLLQSSAILMPPANPSVPDTNAEAYTLKPVWNKTAGADYYEIEFGGRLYTTIRDTALLFEDLEPETVYTFQLRAVNKGGKSDWVQFSGKTKMNPLEFAIKNIYAETTAPVQEGEEISHLFDFDESTMWHSRWGARAIPFDVVMDMRSINQLDKLQYLPRSRGNGIWLKGTVYYSLDKANWTEAGAFEWQKNGDTKEFDFTGHPTARYIKISVTDGVNGYGSGRELYVYKVPGTESFIPGDINNDHIIDHNDLTSYMNYTGLRKGDADFEGYVSKGDVNNNGLIDAYDISNVATLLDGGIDAAASDSLAGKIEMTADKKVYAKGEEVTITVRGTDLHSVNALSFALPYNNGDLEFERIIPLQMNGMQNMTNDRLHSNGDKVLYPAFVNMGNKEVLNGTADLFRIVFKARRKITFQPAPVDGILVDRHLHTLQF